MKRVKLFDSIRIGKLELKNRLAAAPMVSTYAHRGDGTVSDWLINWYLRLARNDIGLVTVEATSVHPGGYINFCPGIHDDWQMEGLARLARAIKAHGARAQIQIYSSGQWAHSMYFGHGRSTPLSPSNVPKPRDPKCHVITTEEAKQIVGDFGEAARRAKECGFDMIMIHGAHGLLVAQLMSSWHNARTDEYGGATPEERAKFLLEVIKRVREEVGSDFPLSLRLSVDECLGGERIDGAGRSTVRWGATVEECSGTTGNTLDDHKIYAKLAEEAGINILDISAGHVWYSPTWVSQPMFRPRGCLVPLAKEMRQVVNIPIVVAGRISNPEVAESILQQGHADIIAVGRPLIADQQFAVKAREGRNDEIRTCVACLNCIDREEGGEGLFCMVNPELDLLSRGEEIKQAEKRKRVIVVGAGPGGMEAARIAAIRGHEVTLYDKAGKLGGAVKLAVIPPEKEELGEIIRYYDKQLRILSVKKVLNTEVSPQLIMEERPDAVVVATGGIPLIPDIPGIDDDSVVSFEDVLLGKASAGDRVVIIGGGLIGCDTALFLAEQGKSVTIVRRGEKIGRELSPSFIHRVYSKFKQLDVKMLTGVTYEEINERGLVITRDDAERLLEADTVVIAAGYLPDDSLYNELNGKVPQLYLVGDSREPRSIVEAVHEAFASALAV